MKRRKRGSITLDVPEIDKFVTRILKSISESLEPRKFVKIAAFNWFICFFFSCLLSKKKKKNSTLKTMKLNSLNRQWLKASPHPERCQKNKLSIR